MKKLFLLLILAVSLCSCDLQETRSNLKKYIFDKENAQLPIKLQKYAVNSPEVIEITIDSVSLFFSEGDFVPDYGHLNTTWKIKKSIFDGDDEYGKYSFLSDEYSDFETKSWIIELTNFDDVDAMGREAKYKANWPEKNPFKE